MKHKSSLLSIVRGLEVVLHFLQQSTDTLFNIHLTKKGTIFN